MKMINIYETNGNNDHDNYDSGGHNANNCKNDNDEHSNDDHDARLKMLVMPLISIVVIT